MLLSDFIFGKESLQVTSETAKRWKWKLNLADAHLMGPNPAGAHLMGPNLADSSSVLMGSNLADSSSHLIAWDQTWLIARMMGPDPLVTELMSSTHKTATKSNLMQRQILFCGASFGPF